MKQHFWEVTTVIIKASLIHVTDFYDLFRKRSGDIREILACGTIHDSDLTYVKELGSGNCGTVYK